MFASNEKNYLFSAFVTFKVVGTQMSKKIEQLKELVSDAEEVYHQTVAVKEHISARMTDCSASLQKVQDTLLALGGSDVPTVLAKLEVRDSIYTHWPLYWAKRSITRKPLNAATQCRIVVMVLGVFPLHSSPSF